MLCCIAECAVLKAPPFSVSDGFEMCSFLLFYLKVLSVCFLGLALEIINIWPAAPVFRVW